jgi:hypothetical protein
MFTTPEAGKTHLLMKSEFDIINACSTNGPHVSLIDHYELQASFC